MPNQPHIFARLLRLPVAAANKQRLSDERVVIDTIVGEVEGKDVIILDDEIANGGTVLEVVERLHERHVGRIIAVVLHAWRVHRECYRTICCTGGYRGNCYD